MKKHTPHFTFIKLRKKKKNNNTIKYKRLDTAAGACKQKSPPIGNLFVAFAFLAVLMVIVTIKLGNHNLLFLNCHISLSLICYILT